MASYATQFGHIVFGCDYPGLGRVGWSTNSLGNPLGFAEHGHAMCGASRAIFGHGGHPQKLPRSGSQCREADGNQRHVFRRLICEVTGRLFCRGLRPGKPSYPLLQNTRCYEFLFFAFLKGFLGYQVVVAQIAWLKVHGTIP